LGHGGFIIGAIVTKKSIGKEKSVLPLGEAKGPEGENLFKFRNEKE
jgi:hypothetical protein